MQDTERIDDAYQAALRSLRAFQRTGTREFWDMAYEQLTEVGMELPDRLPTTLEVGNLVWHLELSCTRYIPT